MIHRAASPSLVATVAGLLLLGGCLAEFHTDQPKPVAPAATVGVAARTEVQGTAAIGLPIVGGTVSAICVDQNPTPVTTAANGTFQLNLPFELSAPCILRVSGGTVNNIPSTRVMYGYVEQTGVGNITPLTELVLARAAAAQPATVYSGFTFTNDVSDNIDNALRAAKTYVLAQLTAATGFTVPSIDLLTGAFAIGDPMDLLLDELGARLRAANHTQDELRALAVTGGNFAPLIPPLPTGPIVVPEPIWGSLTITGTGLPAAVLTPFKPNNLPVQTTQRLGWTRTSLVGATIVSNQTVNVNYTAGVLSSISLQAGAITATVSCPSTACDAPTLVIDTLAKTVTFNDLPMTIGAVAATIKGILQYSDFGPYASNSIDSVALAACPHQPTSRP